MNAVASSKQPSKALSAPVSPSSSPPRRRDVILRDAASSAIDMVDHDPSVFADASHGPQRRRERAASFSDISSLSFAAPDAASYAFSHSPPSPTANLVC